MTIEFEQVPQKSPEQINIENEVIPEAINLFTDLKGSNPKTEEEMLDFDDKLVHLDGLCETVFQFENKARLADKEASKLKGESVNIDQLDMYLYSKLEKDLASLGLLEPHTTIYEKINELHKKIIDIETDR